MYVTKPCVMLSFITLVCLLVCDLSLGFSVDGILRGIKKKTNIIFKTDNTESSC